jgi:tRNA uridine 5-carboxymethylaminomethyl modification enzyme
VLAAAGERGLAHAVPIVEVAKRGKVALGDLFAAAGVGADLAPEAVITADLEIKYAGYLARERKAAARLERLATFALPDGAPYDTMRSVSVEARQKLAVRRPATLAQAASIPGVSPADLQNLVLEMERWRRA